VAGGGSAAGSVYVFDVTDPSRPVQRAKLLRPGVSGPFGVSLAIKGNFGFVGAGQVFVYDLTTGEELSRLQAPDGAAGDVTISGNTLVVRASVPGDIDAAVLYLFDVEDPRHPVPRLKLAVPPDARCPCPVAISGNLILLGSTFDGADLSSGAAWLFDAATGHQLSKFSVPHAGEPIFGFGHAVALSGGTAVVGASSADGHGIPFTTFGAAYVFDVSDPRHPVQLLKLTASDGENADGFGASIAVSGTTILIGAPQTLGIAGGRAYVFRGRALP
jgi:hypothetical protein